MKRTLTIILSIVMVLSLLVGCSDKTASDNESTSGNDNSSVSTNGGENGTDVVAPTATEEITDYVFYWPSEMTSFNILNTTYPGNFRMLTNCMDPLLTTDNHGRIVPCLAEDYSMSSDGLTYTFNLRDGATWVDYQGNYKADVIAEDWLWGLEWVLNFYKNGSYNVSNALGVIEGAQEYYDYTQSLTEAEALALDLTSFKEMVGIETPDEHTIVYHLVKPVAYFASIATSPTLYPLSKGQIDEVGVEGLNSITFDKLWYSGPYTMTTFVENNSKIFTANPAYWDTEVKRFNTVTIKIVESNDIAYQLYQNGEIDDVELSSAVAISIANDPTSPYHDYLCQEPDRGLVFGIWFNYARNNYDDTPDTNWNTAVANEAFRKCFYYLDYTNYLASNDPINPLSVQTFTVSCANLASFDDGTDYSTVVKELLGIEPSNETYVRYDADKLAAYKAQAMEELSEQGVTFPISIELWTNSTQSSIDDMTVMKETLEDNLGTDFIVCNINTYISSFRQEVVTPSYASVVIDGEGASYADPLSYLEMLCMDIGDNADLSVYIGNVPDSNSQELIDLYNEYTDMIRAADAIVGDNDARLQALAEAEAFSLEHALMIPVHGSRTYMLTHTNLFSRIASTSDFQAQRFVNWETNVNAWTTEDSLAFEAAFNAGN